MAVKHQGLAWRVEWWTNLARQWSRDTGVQDLARGGRASVRDHSGLSRGLVHGGGCPYNKSWWNTALSCVLVCKSYITGFQHFVPRRRLSVRVRGNCHCCCAPTVISLAVESKGQITSPPQTFGLMSKWGSVVISALSPEHPCFSLSRATWSKASPWCDPACTDSSGGTANPFICRRSPYLPHGDGWEESAPLRPAQNPWGRDIPASPSVHKEERGGKGVAGIGEGCRRRATSKTQTNLKQEMT